MEVLCSDKTGTLTKNQLSISNPVAYVGEVRTLRERKMGHYEAETLTRRVLSCPISSGC
jgi:magnesium-transporting ATPase (P-type)